MDATGEKFVIEVDNDGMCSWSLVDASGATIAGSDGFPSTDECRDSIEAYKAAHAAYADVPIDIQGTVPNI